MKKIALLLLVSITLCVTQSHAQRATIMPLAAGDTVTNTGTASKIITNTGGYSGVYVIATVTKISGTVGGTIGIYASLDGTTYVQIGSDQTVTNTSGTKGYTFTVSTPVPVYLKVLATGTGTMSAVLAVQYVQRKYQTTP